MLRRFDLSLAPVSEFLTETFFLLALPAETLRLAARFFCQGSPLRSDKRKPGALDSADV